MKKRVLKAVDWFPPAFKAGGPIRSAYNLAAFLSQTHEVWVVTSNRDLDEVHALDVRANQWNTVETSNKTVQVCYTSDIDKSQWEAILDEVKPEVVHLNSLFSKGFTLLPLRRPMLLWWQIILGQSRPGIPCLITPWLILPWVILSWCWTPLPWPSGSAEFIPHAMGV